MHSFSRDERNIFNSSSVENEITALQDVIKRDKKLTTNTILALESIKPGLVLDSLGTSRPMDLSMEELSIVLEDIEKYKKFLIGGVIGAIITFILKLIFSDTDASDKRAKRSSAKEVEKVVEGVKDEAKKLEEVSHAAKINTANDVKQLSDEKREHIKTKLVHLTGMDENAARGIVSHDKSIRDYLFSDKFRHDIVLHNLKDSVPHCITNPNGSSEQHDLSNMILAIYSTAKERVDNMTIVTNAYITGVNPHNPSQVLTGPLAQDEKLLPPVYDKDTKAVRSYLKLPEDTPIVDVISAVMTRVDEVTSHHSNASVVKIPDPDKLLNNYTMLMQTAQEKARDYVRDYGPLIKPLTDKIVDFEKTVEVEFNHSGNRGMPKEFRQAKAGRVNKNLIHELKMLACLLSVMDRVDKRFDRLTGKLNTTREHLGQACTLVTETEHLFKVGGHNA